MKKVAMIGEIHEDGVNLLKKNEIEVINLTSLSLEKLKNDLKNVDGIILRTAELNEEILKHCNNLKIVSRHGVGYDNVDLKFLNNNNIALAITGTSNAITVSEHVMTMFLYLCKLINKSDQLVRNGNFLQKKTMPKFFEMYKKNILILGFGRIGRELAKRCLGFESNVYVFDPLVDLNTIENYNCKKINLDDGLKIADFVSLHVPLNNKTKNLINREKFNLMKKNCIIINTARGGIINEDDLFWALSNKKIHGAGLDVYEKEPPDNKNPLFELDNIILSPHNASLTVECRIRMSIETCENILYFLNNKNKINLNNIINKKNINL